MMGERGPEIDRHLPEYRSGCYRNRIDDCCWLCVIRIVSTHLRGVFRIGTERAGGTHELVGERVELPVTEHAEGTECVERRTGEITEVFDLADEPNVVTVQLESGERLALSIEHV